MSYRNTCCGSYPSAQMKSGYSTALADKVTKANVTFYVFFLKKPVIFMKKNVKAFFNFFFFSWILCYLWDQNKRPSGVCGWTAHNLDLIFSLYWAPVVKIIVITFFVGRSNNLQGIFWSKSEQNLYWSIPMHIQLYKFKICICAHVNTHTHTHTHR